MNKLCILVLILLLLFSTIFFSKVVAQPSSHSGFDIDIDPIAYALNGFSVHGGYISGTYRFDLGVFGIDIPEWLHGNENFDASFVGIGWKIDRFFKGNPDGFFTGIEGSISWLSIIHTGTNQHENQVGYLLGIRGGYRWNTGLGNLFITPWLGLGYNPNAKDITIAGDTFEDSSFQPFPTVHIGWRF